ncbi:MAG: helix-turn-helix domain-containing protein, partial [Steroidobacteraceae bacterium]
ARLRAARERKALTVLQAAEKMHVDARILESLEAEDFAALGARVYARGHLRHYAELVGESAAELQELYANATRAVPSQPDLTRISRAQFTSDPGKLAGPALVVLVAIALLGTLWWLLTLSGDKPQPTPVAGRIESNAAGKSVPASRANDGH